MGFTTPERSDALLSDIDASRIATARTVAESTGRALAESDRLRALQGLPVRRRSLMDVKPVAEGLALAMLAAWAAGKKGD